MVLNKLYTVIYKYKDSENRNKDVLNGLQLYAWKQRINSHLVNDEIISVVEAWLPRTLNEKISKYIIECVQEESDSSMSGFQYTIENQQLEEKFNCKLDKKSIEEIENILCSREEVADVQVYDNLFDVVLYTNYAPNYIEDNEEY